jgi:hypothetical protein
LGEKDWEAKSTPLRAGKLVDYRLTSPARFC